MRILNPPLIIIFVSAFSYLSHSQSNSFNKEKNIGEFTYFEPIFIHQNSNFNNKILDRFEGISVVALDSVFKADKNKYKINEKNSLSLTPALKEELMALFYSVSNKKQPAELSLGIKSINETSNNRYCLFLLIRTESSLSAFTTPINKIRLEIIVYDLHHDRVVFYKKSKNLSPMHNGGYTHTLIKNLNYIYKEISKQ